MKKGANNMTPSKLRWALIGSIVLLSGLSFGGFWLFSEQLNAYATEVRTASAAASTSTSDIARLKQIGIELEEDQIAVTRAKSIVADSKYYQYQDQIIADLTAYAKTTKVQISGITFDSTTSASGAPAAPAPAIPGAAPTPAGLKSIKASVTLRTPVNYQALIKFIHAIEVNLTKMQITGVSLQRDPTSESITVAPLTIEVYTR